MEQDKKIGFIGFGNMAQAIAGGLIGAGVTDGSQIYACAGDFGKLQRNADKFSVRALRSAAEVIENSDFVVLAVKPYLIEPVTAPVLGLLQKKAVISVAAGYDFERYEKILRPGTRHISTIPNTPIAVGEGIWSVKRSTL